MDFAAELEQLRPTLMRFAVLQLRDEQAAEDVVQDALLAAFEARGRFSGRSKLKTWLIAIVKNKLVDRIRQCRREAPPEQELDIDEYEALFEPDGHWHVKPADWGDPAKVFERYEFFDVLELCMRALPEAMARVFLMREVLEMETQEICKELTMTTSNCGVVLYRARMRLRECLQTNWFSERPTGLIARQEMA